MTELPYTLDSLVLVQEFIDETKRRVSVGSEFISTYKASIELEELALNFDIKINDIETAILALSPENYYRGIDQSNKADFNICAFSTVIGIDKVQLYLKYGLEVSGLQILIFSNHKPAYPMLQPFKN